MMMHDFHYKQGELYCESVSVAQIARRVGTPFYLYSYRTFVEHLLKIQRAFRIPVRVSHAVSQPLPGALARTISTCAGATGRFCRLAKQQRDPRLGSRRAAGAREPFGTCWVSRGGPWEGFDDGMGGGYGSSYAGV